MMGQSQFKGVQIYDVIQDHDLNYWFATNEGLYVYDFYKYEKINCDEDKSNSVFGFKINKEGIIFCHNLNNQIFQIKDKKCTLFYELANEEGKPDINLSIGDDDNLLIAAKNIYVVNKKGKRINETKANRVYIGSGFNTRQNQILYHLNGKDSVIIYSKGVFTLKKIHGISETKINTDNYLRFFKRASETYALDIKNNTCYLFDEFSMKLIELPNNMLLKRSSSVYIYETGNEIWAGSTLNGIVLFNETISPSNGVLQYSDYFISDVYKDAEGNYLLSTFDKGIIVIPDLKVPDVINPFKEDPISSLTSDQDIGLLLGSSKGNVLNYNDNKINTINSTGIRPINSIHNYKNSNLILFDDGIIKAYNKETKTTHNLKIGSLKDAVFVSDKLFYLGTNFGIRKSVWDGKNTFTEDWVPNFEFRIYALEFNPLNKSIYASSANGLYYIDSLENGALIEHYNEPIFPTSIYYHNNKVYAAIKKKGIFVIKGNQIIDSISILENNKSIQINKLIIFKNTILIKSLNRLLQYDLDGNLLRSIHSVFGFSDNRVIDFCIHQDYLWVSHSGGVQKINLDYQRKKGGKQNLNISKIIVNNNLQSPVAFGNFNSSQRKIQIELSVPTLLNHESIHYYYKLNGYDTDWNINNFESNIINYNALSPGNYTFIAKLENQGVFSQPISYSFKIAYPYYAQWWFISIIIIAFICFVYIIYRYQLNIQRKKSQQLNELNSSKLIAIQSQMNPHFIFNSLNSIQDLVLKGDVEKSYSYITTFSNLVRRTLSYSEKDFIEFEQEIKLLEIYLSLEKLRFKKDFNYEILFHDIEDIMIPPLLIQPFVENSLIHGLLHKEGSKHIKIEFELQADVLICTIADNGVGREKSKAIKLRQKSEHESFSGKAIQKRFEILSNVFKGKYGYFYEDLTEEDLSTGTKVTLTIPIRHKF
jgi:hypothetical protein